MILPFPVHPVRRVLFTAALLLATALSGHAGEPRATFPNSLAPFPTATTGTAATAAHVVASRIAAPTAAQLASTIDFSVAMRMRNFDEFQARVSNGETVPFEEIEAKYLPLQSDYDAARQWLVGQGFTVTMDDARRLNVFARGTAAQVQTSLATTMQSVTVGGVAYTAAATAPSLPASIASGVLGINGLQPYLQARKHSRALPMTGLSPQSNTAIPYYPNGIRTAYDGATLTSSGTTLTGAGQKVAILIDAFPNSADLTQFWSDCGISQSLSNIETIDVPKRTMDADNIEDTLDVSWSSSIAPGCKVRVYGSDNLQFSSIDKCLSQIATDVTGTAPAQPQIHELSLSLGIGEMYLAGSSEFTTESYYFTMIANGSTQYGGVSVFVSTGDNGSTPDNEDSFNGPLQPSYESTDPNVTAVGGTALVLNPNTGQRSTEVVWNDGASGEGATGGGTSSQFTRPIWQKGNGVPTGTMRTVPDVALVGAGSTPCHLVFTDPSTKVQSDYYVYGTSWSAPTCAGFAALMNQGRSVAGRLPLGLLNPRIYPLIGTNNFYDVTSGNNVLSSTANGQYAATVGYDECSGIGVPDVANLLSTLLAPAPTITSFNPTGGPVGTSVVITGTNFYNVGTVLFKDTNATGGLIAATAFTVNSPTQITVTVPTGATSGVITVQASSDAVASATSYTVGNFPDLTVAKSHAGSFTQADAADTYTLTVSNGGTAATSGTITVTDTLPTGLTATNLTGTGWTIAANSLSATRTDALAAGSSYPALTLTVSVSSTAATSVTNTATVSGGGELNTANDSASDPTAITALTPSQAWRYEYFGTTADTGNAADTANPSGDGISNLTKYALGLNPLLPEVNPETVDTTTGYLRLTVPRNPNATDITYSVQVTSDLTNPASWTTMGTTIDQDNTTASQLQVQDNTPVSGTAKRFIRLQVSR